MKEQHQKQQAVDNKTSSQKAKKTGYACLAARSSVGMDAPDVRVEVHIARGLPKFVLVGLGDTAVRESRERVRSAIHSSGFEFPLGRIVVNLAPADLPKDGTRFDLAIALGILCASGQISIVGNEHYEYLAELSLEGQLMPVTGLLPSALRACQQNHTLVIAKDNLPEAALVSGLKVYAPVNLLEAVVQINSASAIQLRRPEQQSISSDDHAWGYVRGQPQAMRALMLAAAGGHHALLVGPPGIGKTMLASHLSHLLPTLTEAQALESCALRSLANEEIDYANWRARPFRQPHHSASAAAIVGGGTIPRPGEISLAHHGILFLDELTLFDRRTLESLRQPLERGSIVVSRAKYKLNFPSRFQLIAAMNPCPCGYFGHPNKPCVCTPEKIASYLARISGPILDRIDIQLRMEMPNADQIQKNNKQDSGAIDEMVRAIRQANDCQYDRQGCNNASLDFAGIEKYCILEQDAKALLERVAESILPSMRARANLMKLSRTVADLDQAAKIRSSDIAEALQLRCLDRSEVL